MNEYYKTYGEPGESDVRTHIVHPGMDMAMCGMDIAGDELVHDKQPEGLPRGKKYRVTCLDCLRIIGAVQDHLASRDAPITDSEPLKKQDTGPLEDGWYWFLIAGEEMVLEMKTTPAPAVFLPRTNSWKWVVDLALGGAKWVGPIVSPTSWPSAKVSWATSSA